MKGNIKGFDIQFFGGEENPGGTPPPAPAKPEKSFSQADVDRIVDQRLKQERKKHEDYDDLKAKAAKYDELENKKLLDADEFEKLLTQKEDEHKAELGRLTKELDEMKSSEKTRAVKESKIRALKEAKYPDEKIEALLDRVRGETDDEIKADVASLVKAIPPVNSTDGGGNPLRGDNNPDDEEFQKNAREKASEKAKYTAKMLEEQKKLFG